MSDEPRKCSATKYVGAGHLPGVKLRFDGELYKGDPMPLDTNVTIDGGVLCAISWKDMDAFTEEMQAVIDKYLI